MSFVFEQRASTIIFNLLTSIDNDKTFLIPSNICPIVIAVFLKAEKPFELVDISPKTFCINESKVLKLISEDKNKYGGLLFVRTYGIQDSFESFFKSLKDHN